MDIPVMQDILGRNDEIAGKNKSLFDKHGILAINLLAAFAILRIPWYVGIILIVAFISAMFAQKTAYTYKQQFFRGLIWAVSNFILSALFLFILVYMGII